MKGRSTDYDKLQLEELNYNSYLQVPQLLDLQQRQTDPPHHDEMFFIIIHQSFELWFKECLHETDRLVFHLQNGSVSRALKITKRLNAIFETLTQQIQLLSTLTPAEFAGFRASLGTGSGFQSVQFRELEFAFGLRDEWFMKFFADDSFAIQRLQKRLTKPSVYEELLRALKNAGYDVPETHGDGLDERVLAVFKELYSHAEENYHWVLLFEAMIDFDMLFSKWRSVHILMVSRTIGGQPGTGGSSGGGFLEGRLPHRFFPELWEVRNRFWAPQEKKP